MFTACSQEVKGKSQKPDKPEGTIEHSNGNENQYGVIVEHKSVYELHPIKLKRQVANHISLHLSYMFFFSHLDS